MKTSRFTFAFSVVVASAALFLSSCNQLNNEINNIDKKGGRTVSDPTTLTLSGVLEYYHGECDELRAYENLDWKHESLLGSCKVGSKGEFTLNVKADESKCETLGAGSPTYATHLQFIPSPSTTEDSNVKYSGFICLYGYKNGKGVGVIQKLNNEKSSSTFVYCTKAYFAKKSFYGYFPNIIGYHNLDYKINKGWTEIVTTSHLMSDPNLNVYDYSNVVPSDMSWYCVNTDSTLHYPVKKQMECKKVQ